MTVCRDCERETPAEALTPSGLCADCIPSTAGTGRRPTPATVGPGRQAVRDLLAPMRAARAARERERSAALADARPTDLPTPTPRRNPR